nr:MAG TPA: ERF superfamily protein [Bacteriophage sp.]
MTDPQETIYAAFAAAQAEFRPVIKNRVNPAFHSTYADLQSILDAVRPALNRHGLALTQRVGTAAGAVTVETILLHGSGESLSSGPIAMPYAGKIPAQAMGSALTYARRYSLSAFLGVTSEDDDDGNASGTQAPQEQAPAFVLTQAMVDAAKAAAAKGVAEYEKYFKSRPVEEKRALVETGWHKSLKDAAEAAGSAS